MNGEPMTTATLDGLIARLENYYDFECEGGPLKNCVEWQELKSRLTALRTGSASQLQKNQEDTDTRVDDCEKKQ